MKLALLVSLARNVHSIQSAVTNDESDARPAVTFPAAESNSDFGRQLQRLRRRINGIEFVVKCSEGWSLP